MKYTETSEHKRILELNASLEKLHMGATKTAFVHCLIAMFVVTVLGIISIFSTDWVLETMRHLNMVFGGTCVTWMFESQRLIESDKLRFQEYLNAMEKIEKIDTNA